MALSLTKRQLLEKIAAQQSVIISSMGQLLSNQEELKMDFDTELKNLQDKVQRNNDLEDGAITLIKGLGDQIRASAGNPAQLRALADTIDSKANDLAAAVTANTQSPPETAGSTEAAGSTDPA